MNLPFLKNRRLPRIQTEAPMEEMVQGPESDVVDHYVCNMLLQAIKDKDVAALRECIDSLVMNAFDWDGEDASDEG